MRTKGNSILEFSMHELVFKEIKIIFCSIFLHLSKYQYLGTTSSKYWPQNWLVKSVYFVVWCPCVCGQPGVGVGGYSM